MVIFRTEGQALKQFIEPGAAFLPSALIGLEREVRRKSAGLRTYTVVGTTAALFLLVSKYGFTDVLAPGLAVLDPSRVAAQTPEKLKQVPAGPQGCCSATEKPRKALCGGIKVGVIYDLSKPGANRIRIDRYDESDITPGQKLGDLPIVHSNRLTILENPLAGSSKLTE